MDELMTKALCDSYIIRAYNSGMTPYKIVFRDAVDVFALSSCVDLYSKRSYMFKFYDNPAGPDLAVECNPKIDQRVLVK